jgi:hypothetical protein
VIIKSFCPVEEAVSVCTPPVNPLIEVIPPADPASTTITSPFALTERTLPLDVVVAVAELMLVNVSPPTVEVAVEVKNVVVAYVLDALVVIRLVINPLSDVRLVVEPVIAAKSVEVAFVMNALVVDD